MKMKLSQNRIANAIHCGSSYGPVFGVHGFGIEYGGDFIVSDNSHLSANCSSSLGSCFRHPKYEEESNEAMTFLAGSNYFQISEIEVYLKN